MTSDRNIGYDAKDPWDWDAEVKFYCDACGEAIFEGETYYDICSMSICEKCIADAAEIA